MKRWFLSLILLFLGMVISGYLIVELDLLDFPEIWNDKVRAKQQIDPAKMPDVNVPRDVLELRQRHHLRPLATLEDGRKPQDVPNGIYGFSMCNVPSLNAKRDKTSSIEIHKHEDGIVYYVGYASENHLYRYLTRQKNFHLLTSPKPLERDSILFEIPVDFVSKCEQQPLKEGYIFDLFVTVIPEYKE